MKTSSLLKLSMPKLTVILPMKNASSTVEKALKSIFNQDYPIQEVILVDNASTDNSVKLVEDYKKSHSKIPIRVFKNKTDLMVARSFNRGIRAAKTSFVVLMHSDCCFATKKELRILLAPMIHEKAVIATYGVSETPFSIWEEYSFWEKCLMARFTGKAVPGLAGKIDCHRRDVLLRIGGFDEINYANFGGEDADLHLKLRKIGRIVPTQAKSFHLHYLFKDFSFSDLLDKKKRIARTYGRLLRLHGFSYGLHGIFSHMLRPILAIGSIIPVINIFFIPALLIFVLLYYQKMFTTVSTLTDPRIILLPVVGIFLMYYESFWVVESFLVKVEPK